MRQYVDGSQGAQHGGVIVELATRSRCATSARWMIEAERRACEFSLRADDLPLNFLR